MTILGLTNTILQLFFIRLTKHKGIDLYTNERVVKFSIMYWVVPFTGWWDNFIFTNKQPKFLFIK